MQAVRIQNCRYIDDSQPGWVECKLIDVLGHQHVFVEKVPVVAGADLDAASSYPQSGVIACTVVATRERDDGRDIVRIDTQTSDGVVSTAGLSQFEVFPEQLCEGR